MINDMEHLFIMCLLATGNLFFFLQLHLWLMEAPRLGVESELQLPAYVTATATPEPSHTCNLHRSLQQRQILNPMSKDRD